MAITLGIVGNVVTVTATFMQTIGGVANTPTAPAGAVSFTLRTADSATVLTEVYPTGSIVQVSPTTYSRTYVCTVAGEYIVEVTAGPGAGQAARDAVWNIAPSALYT